MCVMPFTLAQRNVSEPGLISPGTQLIPSAGIYPLQKVASSTSAAVTQEASYQDDGASDSDVPFPNFQTPSRPQQPALCALSGILGTRPPGGDTGTLAT